MAKTTINIPDLVTDRGGVAGRHLPQICINSVLLLLVLWILISPALAQLTSGPQSPAVSAGRDVSIVYGFTPEEVQRLTAAAASGAVGPLADKIVDLSNKIGVTQGAAVTMLRILGHQDVPLEKLPQKLAEVAQEYKSAKERLAALNPEDPITGDLVKRANEAFNSDPPRLDVAEELVSQAEQAEIAAAHQAQQLAQQAHTAADQRLLRAAADRGMRGKFAMIRLNYRAAAEHFREAAKLVPSGYPQQKGELLNAEADALHQEGSEHGNNPALVKAIATYRLVSQEQTRDRVPLNWAMTQNNLGIALSTLGERESGTARLEEALAAFRAALEERIRDRAPLDWAATQNNLGIALQKLGNRESGTARLEEALATFRAALEERTRDRVPLDWAATQMNLGNALQKLGERESGTARLEEALAAFRAALEEQTRDRVPLDWAMTKHNLGNALLRLSARDGDTAHLQDAVAAYRVALEERTRDRVPLDWAATQFSMGSALVGLGGQTRSREQLKEALLCFQKARPVFEAAGMTQHLKGTDQIIAFLQGALATLPEQ